jgi:cytosine deaminase
VVFAENRTFQGAESLLRSRGVEVVNLDLPEAAELMRTFIERHPTVWNEDIAV